MVLVAADPGDLLDQVLGPLDVEAPARDAPAAALLGHEAERGEDALHLGPGHRSSEQPVHLALRQGDDARLRGARVDVDAPAPDRPARQLGDERRSAVERPGSTVRSAPRSKRCDASVWSSCRRAVRRMVPGSQRRLEQHAGGAAGTSVSPRP